MSAFPAAPWAALSVVPNSETKFDHRGKHTVGVQKYFRISVCGRGVHYTVRDVSKLPFQSPGYSNCHPLYRWSLKSSEKLSTKHLSTQQWKWLSTLFTFLVFFYKREAVWCLAKSLLLFLLMVMKINEFLSLIFFVGGVSAFSVSLSSLSPFYPVPWCTESLWLSLI